MLCHVTHIAGPVRDSNTSCWLLYIHATRAGAPAKPHAAGVGVGPVHIPLRSRHILSLQPVHQPLAGPRAPGDNLDGVSGLDRPDLGHRRDMAVNWALPAVLYCTTTTLMKLSAYQSHLSGTCSAPVGSGIPVIQMGRLCHQPYWLCIDRFIVYACKQWACFATCKQYHLYKQGHIYLTPLQRDTTKQGVRPSNHVYRCDRLCALFSVRSLRARSACDSSGSCCRGAMRYG